MRGAAKSFPLPGKARSNYSRLFGAMVEVSPEEIPHKKQKWVTDMRSVRIVNQPGKPRVIRYRPRFDEWSLEFCISILDPEIAVSKVKDVLEHAGLYNGLGDNRPADGGKHGKFIVTEFVEIERCKKKKKK